MFNLTDIDLGSRAGRLEAFRAITDEVYGSYTPGQPWKPKPYAEGKGRQAYSLVVSYSIAPLSYLWTDAFGVCNYITLACETGEAKFLDQADMLIDEVHDTLGRDRSGRRRLGRATDEAPTRGGLRIGKEHDEGHPDGDGQYFHYLTKWAFALNRMSLARRDKKYNRWAVQLMEAIHPHFVAGRGSAHPRMFWKVSIDMSRPLVNLEGNLDWLLQEAAGGVPVLHEEMKDMETMVRNKFRRYYSDDPLDLGEALWLSHWGLAQGEAWARLLTGRSLEALEVLWEVNPQAGAEWRQRVLELLECWAGQIYARDRDITPVMFCASLVPGVWDRGYQGLQGHVQSAEE
ncbi:hypothetical protein N2152v2_010577 [Parachlorella kessleri]